MYGQPSYSVFGIGMTDRGEREGEWYRLLLVSILVLILVSIYVAHEGQVLDRCYQFTAGS
jgi:hypothetical protein